MLALLAKYIASLSNKIYLYLLSFVDFDRFLKSDEFNDYGFFKVTVPENVRIDEVSNKINECHELLSRETKREQLPDYGRCESCENYGRCGICSDCEEGSEYVWKYDGLYEYVGRQPKTLIDFVCEKEGWKVRNWNLI